MKKDSAQPLRTLRAVDPPPENPAPAQLAAEPEVPAPLPTEPRKFEPFSQRTRIGVLLIGGTLVFLFLVKIAGILHPFIWAIVVAYILNPLVRGICRRTGMPRPAAVTLVSLLGIGLIAGVLALAVPRLNAQMTQLASDLPSITRDLQARYFGYADRPLVVAGFSIDVPQVTRQVANGLNATLSGVFGGAFSAVVTTIERLAQFLLFIIVTFYLLLDAPQIAENLKRVVPGKYRDEAILVAGNVNRVLSQYMRAQVILIAIMSTASFIVLSIMGVRFAIVLAPIVGLLEIFPIIGPFAAITLVTLIATFSPPHYGLSHTSSAVVIAVTFFIMRQIEDYAVIPFIVGHAVRLHPALILFAVAAGTAFGGALGLFLAVPVTGALKVLAAYLYQKLSPE